MRLEGAQDMIYLAIGDLFHNPDYAWMGLKGSSSMSGIVGANYEPAISSEEEVNEEILLTLKGTHAQMDTVIQALEQKIMLANRYSQERIGYPHYLRVTADQSGVFYYSRILNASLTPAKKSMTYYAGGSLGMVLKIRRKNYFDSDEVALPISGSGMGDVTTGLPLVNHDDSGHDHAFYAYQDDVDTELPAPLRLEITNTDGSNTLKDLIIGSFQYDVLSTKPKLVYEAETGNGGTTVSSSSATNGSFQRHTWSAAGWTDLTYWAMSLSDLAKYQGRAVRPLIRLANNHAYDGLLMKLSVVSNGVTIWEGNEVPSVAGSGFVEFGILRIPAGETLGTNGPYTQDLHLHVYKEGTSSATLDLDDLILMPTDSFSKHLGLVALAQNNKLIDDAFYGVSYGEQSDYEIGTHIALNRGHFLMPKHNGYFVLFMVNGNGMAPIAQSVSVKAWCRQRRRIL